jgi:hypothetical protein
MSHRFLGIQGRACPRKPTRPYGVFTLDPANIGLHRRAARRPALNAVGSAISRNQAKAQARRKDSSIVMTNNRRRKKGA